MPAVTLKNLDEISFVWPKFTGGEIEDLGKCDQNLCMDSSLCPQDGKNIKVWGRKSMTGSKKKRVGISI